MCLQVKSAEVYHCGLIPVPSSNPPLRSINCVLPSHLSATLYPTPKGVSMCPPKGATNREMISLALQVKTFPDQRIKASFFFNLIFFNFIEEVESCKWTSTGNAKNIFSFK